MKNLQNSDCPFHFLLKEIHLCSSQLRRLHFYKPLSGSSVATLRLAYSKISLPISEKKARERSEKRLDTIQVDKWRDDFSSALCLVL